MCECVSVCSRVRALGASPARRGEAAALLSALGTRSGPAAAAAAAAAARILLREPRAVACTPAGARRPARLLHVAAAAAVAGKRVQPPAPSFSCSSFCFRSKRQPGNRRPAAAAVAFTPWDRWRGSFIPKGDAKGFPWTPTLVPPLLVSPPLRLSRLG